MKSGHRKYILENIGKKSVKEIAVELSLKERQVRRILEKDKTGYSHNPKTGVGIITERSAGVFDIKIPNIAIMFLIIVIGVVVYANSLANEFVFDDGTHVVDNVAIRSLDNVPKIFTHHLTYFAGDQEGYFFRPVESLTFAVDYFFWGLEPLGYHLTNALLHIAVCLLLFSMMNFVTRNNILSGIISLLYVVHPINTEAVAYVSGRADSISSIFLLLMMAIQRKYWIATRYKRAFFHIFILILFTLALLTKELAVLFPLLLMFTEYCFRDENKYTPVGKQWIFFYLPIFAVMAAWFLLRSKVVPTQKMVEVAISMNTRLTSVGRVIYDYLRLSFFPVNLHMEYKLPFPKSLFQSYYFWPSVCLSAILFFFYRLWRKGVSDINYRILFFGLGWFFIALLPYLNIFFILNAPFSEHWLYISEMGLILFYVYFLFYLVKSRLSRMATMAACIVVISLFSGMTITQNRIWKNGLTFYTYNLERAPYSAKMYNNLAMEHRDRGDLVKAKTLLEKAIKISPNYTLAKENLKAIESNTAE